MDNKKRILTGDRPTGPLHLGHYVGSLSNRVKLQNDYQLFVIIADYHAITRRADRAYIQKIAENIHHLVMNYLSVGIDPDKVTIYRQSDVPSVCELSTLFGMITTVPQLERVPTLKEIMKDEHIEQPSYGLLGYPVLQAADILHVKADLVPVGKDQESHIELSRELARRFNAQYSVVFPEPQALVGEMPTLPGIDNRKMSKSLGNAISLSDDTQTVKEKVMRMYTDPTRIHPTDPGHVEGNPVFVLHDTFNDNKEEVADLKERYQKGAVGDIEVKEKLFSALEKFLEPIRERRAKFEAQKGIEKEILASGAAKVKPISEATIGEAKKAMGFSE